MTTAGDKFAVNSKAVWGYSFAIDLGGCDGSCSGLLCLGRSSVGLEPTDAEGDDDNDQDGSYGC